MQADTLSKTTIETAIDHFLQNQYDKKSEKDQKALQKANEQSDLAEIGELNTRLQTLKEKFSKSHWLSEATKMALHVNVGTHISKGVHPSSKGDNVNFWAFNPSDFTDSAEFVGTNLLRDQGILDANSSRGSIDLPLIAFFEWEVLANSGIKMRDVILNNPQAAYCFDADLAKSKQYHQIFLDCLHNQLKECQTDRLNKQILWPLEGEAYVALVPLFPSVLSREVFQKVQALRPKKAVKNHSKDLGLAYQSIHNLAVMKLGGTKPQNISYLTNQQSGRTYLLPSLPPHAKQNNDFNIRLGKRSHNIFKSRAFYYHQKSSLNALFGLIKQDYNNRHIRQAINQILSDMTDRVLLIGRAVAESHPAGWSKEYDLPMHQKYWLDPKRADLDAEFKQDREESDWHDEIAEDFAKWLQDCLKKKFHNRAYEFADPQHNQWHAKMLEKIKRTLHFTKGELV